MSFRRIDTLFLPYRERQYGVLGKAAFQPRFLNMLY